MKYYRKRQPASKAKQYRQKFSAKRNRHKVHYFRLRQTNTAALTSGGTGQINFAVTMNDPSIAPNWTAIALLFDEARVCGYKAVYTPYIPNQDGAVVGFTSFAACSVCHDLTDTSVSSGPTFTINQEYENSRMKNLYKPWSYYVRIPKLLQYSTLAGVTPNTHEGGFWRTDAVPNVGRFYVNAIGLPPTTQFGSISHTFYIKCRSVRG